MYYIFVEEREAAVLLSLFGTLVFLNARNSSWGSRAVSPILNENGRWIEQETTPRTKGHYTACALIIVCRYHTGYDCECSYGSIPFVHNDIPSAVIERNFSNNNLCQLWKARGPGQNHAKTYNRRKTFVTLKSIISILLRLSTTFIICTSLTYHSTSSARYNRTHLQSELEWFSLLPSESVRQSGRSTNIKQTAGWNEGTFLPLRQAWDSCSLWLIVRNAE